MTDFTLIEGFISADEATRLFTILLAETSWAHFKAGFGHLRPRLEAWYGDPGAIYANYNRGMHPLPWTPTLTAIRERVQRAAGTDFNGVLLNHYRNEHDSVAPHSDDEPEFGVNPVIASVSLGCTRRFILRNKKDKSKQTLTLAHGSLLVMSGAAQRDWTHEVPKEHFQCTARINLTFRRIMGDANGPLALTAVLR